MLCELTIQNLALIESLHLVFDDKASGLVILTGETGAGKSIILQAIHLLGGGKGSTSWLRTGADAATIEARFEIDPDRNSLRDDLMEQGVEIEETIILKRVLSANGRSRYYLNNSMATAALVQQTTDKLLAIASQHDHQLLLQPQQHLSFIDAVGDLVGQRQDFNETFRQWQQLKTRHKKMLQSELDKEKRREFLLFQLQEIEAAAIQPEIDAELDKERHILRSADLLQELGQNAFGLLSDQVLEQLASARKQLEQMTRHDPGLVPLADEISSNYYQLEDLGSRLRDYLSNIAQNPGRLEEIEARIDLLQRLKRKYAYGEGGLAEILEEAARMAVELEVLDELDHELAGMARELAVLEKKVVDKAAALSVARRNTAALLDKDMGKLLKELGFGQTEFSGRFINLAGTAPVIDDIGSTGCDRFEFMFSANPGEAPRPLAKIASGGELSRLMLALRCLLASKDQIETVIFDEVDAGIGGRAAGAIAQKIRELGGHHQVFCITHLPQIAALADVHYMVTKDLVNGRTQSAIRRLSPDERVKEIARMLAGDAITDQTVAYARELLADKAANPVPT